MTRFLFGALLFVFAVDTAKAQGPPPAEREAVLASVQAFFDTMAAKDVDGARRILLPEGRFYAVREQDGKPTIRTFTNEEYLKNLPNRKQSARERMWNPDVRIRGSIANVWTLLQVQSSKFQVQSSV